MLEWVAISFSRDILPLIIYHDYGREAGGESRVMGIQEPSVLFFATFCDCIITLKQNPSRFFFFFGWRGACRQRSLAGHCPNRVTKT